MTSRRLGPMLVLFAPLACGTSSAPPPTTPTAASTPSVVGIWLAEGGATTITFKPIDATDKLGVFVVEPPPKGGWTSAGSGKWQPAPNQNSILVYPSGGGAHECVDFVLGPDGKTLILSEGYPRGLASGGAYTCAGDHKPTLNYTKQ